MQKPLRRLALFSAITLSAAAPVTYSPDRGLHAATAECQDGTCCPEVGSTCVVGDHQRADKYYKPSGSCLNQT
ncbi:MAG TPA: hypothetical protein VF006_32085 [Longimicrobium sp.]